MYDFSERPLAEIPIIRVDWNDGDERRLYAEIVALTDEIIKERSWRKHVDELDRLVSRLIYLAAGKPRLGP